VFYFKVNCNIPLDRGCNIELYPGTVLLLSDGGHLTVLIVLKAVKATFFAFFAGSVLSFFRLWQGVVGNQPLSDEESTQLIVCQYPEEEEGDGLSHHSTIPEEERPDIHIAPISDTCSPEIKVIKQLLNARVER
jgi:hypothetical protein